MLWRFLIWQSLCKWLVTAEDNSASDSNSRRSAPVIIAYLLIDQAVGRYCYDRRKFEKVAEIIQQVTSRLSSLSEE